MDSHEMEGSGSGSGSGLGLGFGADDANDAWTARESPGGWEVGSLSLGIGVSGDWSCGNDVNVACDVGLDRLDDWEYEPFLWDFLGFEDQGIAAEDFEWDALEERVLEDARESLSVGFPRIAEVLTLEMEDLGYRDNELIPNLDWELLFAANNMEGVLGVHHVSESSSYSSVGDDLNDTFLGLLADDEYASRGSPPAAKPVVDGLPVVTFTEEMGKSDNASCAICRDEFLLEEKVGKLPCCHYYHWYCIVPWLDIRNSCPVCRYELPTDDAEYERRRSQRLARGISEDHLVD